MPKLFKLSLLEAKLCLLLEGVCCVTWTGVKKCNGFSIPCKQKLLDPLVRPSTRGIFIHSTLVLISFLFVLLPLRKEDSRNYYTQRSFGPDDRRAGAFWVDMDDLQHGQVRMHGLLSNTHKQAAVSETQAHNKSDRTANGWLFCTLTECLPSFFIPPSPCDLVPPEGGPVVSLPFLRTLPEADHHSNRRYLFVSIHRGCGVGAPERRRLEVLT